MKCSYCYHEIEQEEPTVCQNCKDEQQDDVLRRIYRLERLQVEQKAEVREELINEIIEEVK